MANLQSNTLARVAVVSSLETETDSILCNNLVLNVNESTDVVGMRVLLIDLYVGTDPQVGGWNWVHRHLCFSFRSLDPHLL